MERRCSDWLEFDKGGHVGIMTSLDSTLPRKYEFEVTVALEFIGLGFLR
jgi:hypothetical protein